MSEWLPWGALRPKGNVPPAMSSRYKYRYMYKCGLYEFSIFACMHECMYMCAGIHILYICAREHVNVSACMYVCIYIYVYILIHMHRHIVIYKYIRVYTYIHLHVHIKTRA